MIVTKKEIAARAAISCTVVSGDSVSARGARGTLHEDWEALRVLGRYSLGRYVFLSRNP